MVANSSESLWRARTSATDSGRSSSSYRIAGIGNADLPFAAGESNPPRGTGGREAPVAGFGAEPRGSVLVMLLEESDATSGDATVLLVPVPSPLPSSLLPSPSPSLWQTLATDGESWQTDSKLWKAASFSFCHFT